MKIGIDARMVGPRCGGIGRYVQELIRHLLIVEEHHHYIVFVRFKKDIESLSFLDSPRVTFVEAPYRWYSWEEQIKLPKIFSSYQMDLMHFPHWNVPLFFRKPFVVTIHDLIMFHYPRAEATTLGPMTYAIKDKAHHVVLSRSVRAARHILVTSEYTKMDVHHTLHTPLHNMTVTYQAPIFSHLSEMAPLWNDFAEKFHIQKPYVLFVGSSYPHKNLSRLLSAWQMIEDEYKAEYHLVLAGIENTFSEQLRSSLQSHHGAIHSVGYVSDTILSALYAHASLFVFPTLYEGFGLPPLEAMAHGVPVVASNRTCLPEVLGEAALYIDPESELDMARAIIEGLRNEDLRRILRQNAKHELQRYSWNQCARQTLQVYEKAVDR